MKHYFESLLIVIIVVLGGIISILLLNRHVRIDSVTCPAIQIEAPEYASPECSLEVSEAFRACMETNLALNKSNFEVQKDFLYWKDRAEKAEAGKCPTYYSSPHESGD